MYSKQKGISWGRICTLKVERKKESMLRTVLTGFSNICLYNVLYTVRNGVKKPILSYTVNTSPQLASLSLLRNPDSSGETVPLRPHFKIPFQEKTPCLVKNIFLKVQKLFTI
jgi:hypothetical protein